LDSNYLLRKKHGDGKMAKNNYESKELVKKFLEKARNQYILMIGR